MSAPIEPGDYVHGVKVVDIGDLRVARGMTRRPVSTCRHLNLVYDNKERRVWCSDCESEVEPFDALMNIIERLDRAAKLLNRRHREVLDAEAATLRSRAAKTLDDVWRSRNLAPLCPHCNNGILPEDVAGGVHTASREIIRADRKRKEKEQ